MNRPVRPPVEGDIRITSAAGKQRGTYVHLGTDFGPQTPGIAGDPLYAVTDGVLVHQYKSPTFGRTSVLERDNGDGTFSYFVYAHQGRYADDMELSPRKPTLKVPEGKVIGYMGNTGASAEGKPIPVHEHFEQIDTNGRVNFSNGWPFSSKDRAATGVTGSGVTWQKVGSSFALPNGWVARSDAGKVAVNVPAGFANPSIRDNASSGTAASPQAEAPGAGRPSFEERWNALGGSQPVRPGGSGPLSGSDRLPTAPQLMFDPNALHVQPQSFRRSAADRQAMGASDDLRFLTRRAPEEKLDPRSPRIAPPPFMPPAANGLDDRFGHWIDTANGSGEPQRASRPVGVFFGEPNPTYSVQPPIWGLPSQHQARPDGGEDWFSRWIRPLVQQ